MNDNKNLILALVLAGAFLIGWQYFVLSPQMKAQQARQATVTSQQKTATPTTPGPTASANKILSRADALSQSGARVAIDTPTIDGSIRLTGGHFDDLRLKKYRETTDPNSPEIALLSPQATDYPFYVEMGWVAKPGSNVSVPNANSVWTLVSGTVLSPGKPIQLSWNNGKGLTFIRTISVDDQYMFTIGDEVRNAGSTPVTLLPYAFVTRYGVQEKKHSVYIHEGFIGIGDGNLKKPSYGDFKELHSPPQDVSSTGGWMGITDSYFMATVIPPQSEKYDGEFSSTDLPYAKAYQASYRLGARTIAPGANVSVSHRLFAGAKVVDMLRQYEKTQGVTLFDLAVDWGWFIFLTQPLFWVLDQFNHILGNFGLAILALTVLVKLLFFPLANTSFKSMSRMKKVQPEMERIKKQYGEDPQKMQAETMALYKREKVNPLMGCFPILIQMPIFISLYTVLSVTIEMYHVPFYGWIKDLSVQDPTSFLNLFGLLPYAIPTWIPATISIGAWPIMLGITQWVQMKMNPQAADPVQAKMFAFMPLIFTFMFASLPAGLVIYYFWNNLLTLAQQSFIMKKEGVPIALFDNMPWLKKLTGKSG